MVNKFIKYNEYIKLNMIQSQYLSDFVGQFVKKLVKGVIQKFLFGKLHRLSSNEYRISEK